jgi:glycolate oxidase iron-sulfur subunit
MAAGAALDHPVAAVACFPGCHAAAIDSTELAALVSVLLRLNVKVIIPKFVCCGLPSRSQGDISTAAALARRNIALTEKLEVDAVVTSCASCSSALKHYGALLKEDPELAGRAGRFSGKVRDLTEFLLDLSPAEMPVTLKDKVTYHDPCHLVRHQRLRQAPRELLKRLPGIEFVDMPESDMCCGAAGTYAFKNYDLSMKVLKRKVDNIARTGANTVVTSCPACLMQLSFGLSQHKLNARAITLTKLLADALAPPSRSPNASTDPH